VIDQLGDRLSEVRPRGGARLPEGGTAALRVGLARTEGGEDDGIVDDQELAALPVRVDPRPLGPAVAGRDLIGDPEGD